MDMLDQGGDDGPQSGVFDLRVGTQHLCGQFIDRPIPRAGEVLVRVQAAAINPSDVKNVLGKMELTTVPRTPGRDLAGVAEQGPAEWIGRPVLGTGGDLGFRRDGSHAEYLTVPIEGSLVHGPLPELVMSATAGEGVHVVFDVVGGPMFEPCLCGAWPTAAATSPLPAPATAGSAST